MLVKCFTMKIHLFARNLGLSSKIMILREQSFTTAQTGAEGNLKNVKIISCPNIVFNKNLVTPQKMSKSLKPQIV